MPWARLEGTFFQHPKITGLSDGALALWVCAIGYAVTNLTDGRIERRYLASIRPLSARHWLSRRAMELVEAGLWMQDGAAFIIHDFDRYQPTKAQVEADRQGARERMARHRSAERSPEQALNSDQKFARSSRPHPIPSRSTEPPSEVQPRSIPRSDEHRSERAGAARFVELYVDECRQAGSEPVPRDKARIGREARELLEAGKPAEIIAEAVRQTARAGRSPGLLIRIVGDLERGVATNGARGKAEPKSWPAIRNVLGAES